MTLEMKDNLQREINKLHQRFELSEAVGPDYYEPGMMEYLDQSDGSFDETTGEINLKFESRGTRYEGRTEQIEKVSVGDPIHIIRDEENKFNRNNFVLMTGKDQDVGNMPAELCNVIAPLYDEGSLIFKSATVSYVEPISKRSRYAKQAVLFVAVQAKVFTDASLEDTNLEEIEEKAVELEEVLPEAEEALTVINTNERTEEKTQAASLYEGKEPYIFVSYAHKDAEQVEQIIRQLMNDGYRIWYDKGIRVGSLWDDNIAQHVIRCGCVIAFISSNYIASDNCLDEMNLARDERKPMINVYLEDTMLPPGMRMRMSRNQALMKYSLSEQEFYSKLYDAKGIADCKSE